MKQSAVIINKTVECGSVPVAELQDNIFRISGKAAAVYYKPEGFDENNLESLKKRAIEEAARENYSIFEHDCITFKLNTSKIMGMVLKSMNFYNSTEKSTRYTMLELETDIEKEIYAKWKNIFEKLVRSYYGDFYTEDDIQKHAMENARYFTSIFTPTTMIYTVPFSRAVLLSQWLKSLSELMGNVNVNVGNNEVNLDYNWVYGRFATECGELADVIGEAIGVYNFGDIITNTINDGVEFFRVANYILKTKDIVAKDEDLQKKEIGDLYKDSIKEDFYSDCYISNYKASFVAVSQMETHRALHYSIDIPVHCVQPYIPKIIRGSAYEVQWREDFQKLLDMQILPQATLLEVSECGRFEDFYMKCKQRLCSKSQLEITEITRDQVVKFAKYSSNLSGMNQILLGNMIRKGPGVNWKKPETVIVESRCKFADFHCDNPCKIKNDTINYFRNI